MKIAFFTSAHPVEPMGLSFAEKRFPLGVGSLLSVLKAADHEVDFYDRYLTKDITFPDKQYDFVCIYSNTPCFKDTLKIIRFYKDRPEKIVVGGPHTSVYPNSLYDRGVNYIVQGEGEKSLLDIVNGHLREGIIRYARITELDELPLPDYKLFSTMPYLTQVKWFPDNPVYNYISSRGCPFNCSFCDTKQIWGRQYTCFSADRVISNIEYLKVEFGIKGIYFREDNFTCNKDRLANICHQIIDKHIDIKWLCETRVDGVDENMVKLMARAGCKVFYIGFESGSQHMLDIYNKGTTVGRGVSIAKWAKDYGIEIAGSFIIDHPLETAEDKALTRDFINKAGLATVWQNRYRESFDSLVKEAVDAENG